MTVADVASVLAAGGSALAIASVWYQAKATAQLERTKWLRERLFHDAVAAVMGLDLLRSHLSPPPPAEWTPERLTSVYQALQLTDLPRHIAPIKIIAPDSLSAAAAALDDAYFDLSTPLALATDTESLWPETVQRFPPIAQRFLDASETFVARLRSDLGISQPSLRLARQGS